MNNREMIQRALAEDLGYGDITTESLQLGDREVRAKLIAKEEGVIAGVETFCATFWEVDSDVVIKKLVSDGNLVKKGEIICELTGKSNSMLKAERVALNFLQRLSGIASLTRKMVEAIGECDVRLLDTRKTTPLLRVLEKQAVRAGGGYNHRFGLYDMIMLKENHILSAGSITEAVKRVRREDVSHKIEVEVTNLEELTEAVECRVDRVMLDNMSIEEMKEAVELYKGKVEMEASGNINLETIGRVAKTGVDYISSGALTHSYKSMDISLIFEEVNQG